MRNRALLVAAILLLSLGICGLSSAAEELVNDSRKTAVAVRITFMINVMIWDHGDEFDHVEPASGLSNVFVFSGGEVRRHQSFEVEWSPDVPIKSVEWLEVLSAEDQAAMEEVADCSCLLSTTDSLDDRLMTAYDGIVICLEPGIHTTTLFCLWRLYSGINVELRGIPSDQRRVHVVTPQYKGRLFMPEVGTLRFEGISFGEDIHFLPRGDSKLTIIDCEIYILRVSQLGSVVIENSRIDELTATDGATVTVLNSEIGGIRAEGDAVVTIEASTIQGKDYCVIAAGNSTVRLIGTEFIDCGSAISASDSATIDIED